MTVKSGDPRQQNVMHPDVLKIRKVFRAERDAAVERFECAEAILTSHTVWRQADGQNVCDYDGAEWPCSTIGSIGFIVGIAVKGW